MTGRAGALPPQEQGIILEAAARHGVQATFLAAIRLAENGGPGREFGVLSEEASTYALQASVCARSIRNNTFRFVTSHGVWPTDQKDRYTDAFIEFMGSRWAPRGASNDPTDLNRHWVTNVRAAYLESGLEHA